MPDPISPAPAANESPDSVPVGTAPTRVDQLMVQHLGSIWRTAGDLGIAPRDREAVAQEVMVGACRRLNDIVPGKERAFLLAVTARVASNWRRSSRRRPADLVGCLDEPPLQPGAVGRHLRHHFPSADQVVARNGQWTQVQQALLAMTEAQRVAFVRFELEQLSAAHIAEQLGFTQSVVFARLSRARQVLRKLCQTAPAPRNPALHGVYPPKEVT